MAELALEPDPPAVELHEPLRKRQAQPGPLAMSDPRLALLELLEDALPVLGSDAGPVSMTETPDSPLTRVALTSTSPPAGVEFIASPRAG